MASNQAHPVAKGDGFVLTALEVNEICKPYTQGTPKLSDKQCLNIALRMRLFAAEAEKMGLSKDAAPGKQEAMTVARMKALSDLYTAKLLDGYPLKDVVIESYYWGPSGEVPRKERNERRGR